MSENTPDAIVSAILKDFMIGATSPWADACVTFQRAVNVLRISAVKGDCSISPQQRQQIDAAIRTAQPYIANGRSADDLRFMVGALHVITAEWAKTDRPPAALMPDVVLEAFILARMLDNWFDSANLFHALQHKRAGMDEAPKRSLRDLVDELYPLPVPTPEPASFYSGSIH